MRDYSKFPAPREAYTGRRLQIEDRRRENRGIMYGLLALAGMCICIGLAALVFFMPIFNGHPLIEVGSSAAEATRTPTRTTARTTAVPTTAPSTSSAASSGNQPTPIPYGRSGSASNGLKVTVTTFQRPLPAEGVQIPNGQELALVSVRVENTKTSGAALKIRPQDFQMVTPENEAFNPNVGGITTGSMFVATDLEAGKIAEGDIIYYVYSDVKELWLSWKSSEGNRLFALQRAR